MQDKFGSLSEFLTVSQPSDPQFKEQIEALTCMKESLVKLKHSSLNKAGSRSCDDTTAILNDSQNGPEETNQSGSSLKFSKFLLHKPVFFPLAPKPKKPLWIYADYSNVPKRVTSFRPKTTTRREDYMKQKSLEAQQRVRNELMLKNEHHLLRTMKRELKLDSAKDTIVTHGSRGFKQLHQEFSNFKSNSTRPPSPIKKTTFGESMSSIPKTDVLASEEAQRKTIEYTSKQWRERRGLDVKSMPSQVLEFIKALYSILDTQDEGLISGPSLLKYFVSLGVSADPTALSQALINIYKVSDLESLKITQESLEALCKAELRTDSILKVLNTICLDLRSKRPQTVSVTRSVLLDSPRAKSRIGTADGYGSRDEAIFSLVSEEPVSITEQQGLVKKWWKEVNPLLANSVTCNSIADKLVQLGVASDTTEARKVMGKLIGPRRSIDYSDFLLIFARSMMKGAIQSLAQRVSGDLFADLSEAEKILAYKRALLLTGLKYFKYEISPQDGALALSAIKKLSEDASKTQSKLTDEEFKLLILKFREKFNIPYEPEPEKPKLDPDYSPRQRFSSLPIRVEQSRPGSPTDEEVRQRMMQIRKRNSVMPIVDFKDTPEKIEPSKTLEQLAKAETVTRKEYMRLKAEMPHRDISARYIVHEVKPKGNRPTSPERNLNSRRGNVRLSTSSVEKSDKEPSNAEISQAATRPETSAKPTTKRRNAPRRATEFFIRPVIRNSNFIIDRLQRSISKQRTFSRQQTVQEPMGQRAKSPEMKLKADTEILEKYQRLVSHSPEQNWSVVMLEL
mmetsp:Transcript_32624/g.56666  ORF Transcript_32624/g.56666 Transcript_32624/m.56666 type:complete len:793 (+) Transcript_32624:1400-3778(+)